MNLRIGRDQQPDPQYRGQAYAEQPLLWRYIFLMLVLAVLVSEAMGPQPHHSASSAPGGKRMIIPPAGATGVESQCGIITGPEIVSGPVVLCASSGHKKG
jgi:hypothetical protein